MNRLFYLAFVCFAVFSCSVPRTIKNEFLNYSNNVYPDTTLKNRVYTKLDSSVRDSFYTTYILLKDGTFLTGFGGYPPHILSDEIKKATSSELKNYNRTVYNSYYKGLYIIKGDTIIANYVNNPAPPKVWFAYEKKFLILNDCLIRQIYCKQLGVDDRPNYQQTDFNCLPINVIDEIDIWLKYKKWFWLNEMEYKDWKKQHN